MVSPLPILWAECLFAALVAIFAWKKGWNARSLVPLRGSSVIIAVTLFVLGARAVLLVAVPKPVPGVQDEFSYLLSADTFAAGRATNLPHPMADHLDTFFVLQHPTYASKYPPGQGLALAAGQVAGGHPWWGVWAVTGLMCGAIAWALLGFLPPQWALAGAMLAALRLGLLSYWMNSYWGGSLSALGGALTLGAAVRIARQPRARFGIALAAGLVLMAISRPYEGLVFAIACGVVLAAAQLRQIPWKELWRPAVPAAAIVALGAAGLAWYCWRVTYSPKEMPYTAYEEQYSVVPLFLTQPLRPVPTYRTEFMRQAYTRQRELRNYLDMRTFSGFVRRNVSRFLQLWLFFLGPILTLPLLYLPRALRGWRDARVLAVIAALFLIALTIEIWHFPHYAAPFTAALYGLAAMCFRAAGNGRGAALAVGAITALACVLAFRLVSPPELLQVAERFRPAVPWCMNSPQNIPRSALERRLETQGGKHLVLVRYGSGHDSVDEWVYNRANVDAAPVVWARAISPQKDAALLRYFADREVWEVEADATPPRVARLSRPLREMAGYKRDSADAPIR